MSLLPDDRADSVQARGTRFWSKGDVLGRYEMHAELGGGSMGKVYSAFDPSHRRLVAIKTLRPEYIHAQEDGVYRRRFRMEAQAAGLLSHPNVVAIYDEGDDYLVMELVDGVTLASHLTTRGALPVDEALSILLPLSEALAHAHVRGVIHRDLKPSNVMVRPDGSPKLMDFGLAAMPGQERGLADRFLGTPAYMAPEQILHGEATPRSDLFSLGVLAYEMLTGRRPFRGENAGSITYKVVYEEAGPPSRETDGLPRAYDEIFARVLAKDPSRRLPSVTAFTRALESHRGPAAREGFLARPAPRSARGASDAEETQDLRVLKVVADMRQAEIARQEGLAPLTVAEVTEAAPVALDVDSDPAGGSVWVDGVCMGLTPLLMPNLASGPHIVRVTREGFAPVQLTLSLAPGPSANSLQVTLQPEGLAAPTLPTSRTGESAAFADLRESLPAMPLPPRRPPS